MALAVVFDAVAERLGDDVSFGGPDEVGKESRPPRITWEPVADKFDRARRLGGGAGDDGAIWTRAWTVRVQFWGGVFSTTEELVNRFLAILHDLLTAHSYAPKQSVWDTGEVTDKGATCTMLLEIYAPVLRTVQETREVEAIAFTNTIETE